MSAELDYDWLAQQLQITGGNIKNIVLNAAFFAAADGGVIGMEHILRGARGEFEKIGNRGTITALRPAPALGGSMSTTRAAIQHDQQRPDPDPADTSGADVWAKTA